jgi:hypothetical protein
MLYCGALWGSHAVFGTSTLPGRLVKVHVHSLTHVKSVEFKKGEDRNSHKSVPNIYYLLYKVPTYWLLGDTVLTLGDTLLTFGRYRTDFGRYRTDFWEIPTGPRGVSSCLGGAGLRGAREWMGARYLLHHPSRPRNNDWGGCHVCVCVYTYTQVVISRAFFFFFPCNHIINIKKKFLFPAK